MKGKSLVTLAVLLFAINTGAEPAKALSLDQAVQEALRHNPRLIALGHTREAMQERPGQVTGLPNPMVTYRGMDAPNAGNFPNTGEKRIELEQPLPGFGKRGLRQAVAVNEAGGASAELEAMSREIVLRVKESAYELQAVQKTLLISREEDGLLVRMARVAETRYATGEAAQADVIKAQTELTMLKQKRVELEGREKTWRARLAQLMGRDVSALPEQIVAPIPEGPVPDVKARAKDALEKRAEIKAAVLKVDRSELQRQLMTRESQPDYKVGLEYRSIDRGDDMVMFMVGVELPLWQTKNRAAIREAGLMVSASAAEREDMERQVALDVESACYKVETASSTLDLYRKELIPQSQVRLQSSEAGYRAGKLDFNDWLESERFGLNVKTMAVMAEGELGAGWAALERAVGGAL